MVSCPTSKVQALLSSLCDKCDKTLDTLQYSLSNVQGKAINDSYNQHLSKAMELKERYTANIEEAEKGWRGKTQKDKDQILDIAHVDNEGGPQHDTLKTTT